jgi:hypothetical protein
VDLVSFLSLGEGLLVRCNQKVLQVSNLNLEFSLVLEGSGGIIDSGNSNISLLLLLGALVDVFIVFFVVLFLLFFECINEFSFGFDDLLVHFDL